MPNVTWKTYRASDDSGGSVDAHVVTERTEGKFNTVNGSVTALAGRDVLIRHQNEYYVDVVSAKDFQQNWREETDKDRRSDDSDTDSPSNTRAADPSFDPSQRTAAEVRDYLSRVRTRDEYDRVVKAERDGLNRKTAIAERNDLTKGDENDDAIDYPGLRNEE